MPNNVIEIVNKIGKDEEIPDMIHFCNIHKEPILDDLYGDVESQDDSSCASDKSWDMPKDGGEIDQKNIVYNDAVDDGKIDDLNEEDTIHLKDGLANNNNNNNNIKHVGVINQQDEHQNHFGAANNNLKPQNNHFEGTNEHDQDDNDEGQDQGEDNNKHSQTSEDERLYPDDNDNDNDLNDNQQNDYNSPGDWANEPELDNSDDDSEHDPNDIGQPEDAVTISRRSHTMNTQNRLGNVVRGLLSVNNDTGLDGLH